jgi:RNA methyltransferase, TrmH family
MIDSQNNRHLKELRKLRTAHGRAKSGTPPRFVAEGEDLIAAAASVGWQPVERFVAAGSGLEGTEVAPELLAGASSLGSGTRVLAVYEQRWGTPAGPLCVYLHGVGDPGNVGTILRSAQAFGAGSVVLGPGSADPFGPKAVRASMGAVFTMPLARISDSAHPEPAELLAGLPGRAIALAAGSGAPLAGPLQGEATILIGAERDGLPPELLAAAAETCRIPIQAESLNAAMAATVALYELTRKPTRVPAA